jgi:hypothetical protein
MLPPARRRSNGQRLTRLNTSSHTNSKMGLIIGRTGLPSARRGTHSVPLKGIPGGTPAGLAWALTPLWTASEGRPPAPALPRCSWERACGHLCKRSFTRA